MIIKYKGQIVSEKVRLADNFFTRLLGYMFSRKPVFDDGILFDVPHGNSIHTFFMRFDLDVVFLDQHKKVIKIFRGLKPWRITWVYRKARHVLELPAGKLPAEVNIGDTLEVINV
jgi:uncharacterized membrane protein (UPF0127 family)